MSEEAGSQIGRYKVLEKLGEGGMGTIWLAEQREPVRRRVAVKIIKLGMDTKQVIARFEVERQALAMMDHPHIAKVLDAGATEMGRPYFVMEYIKGIPILEYCDEQRLDTNARLELFTSVCQAIQHAHQKGIIHRDIKPSNVLVTLMDGKPIPKVIDFGIAKATNSDLTAKTLFTAHRQMIGTPAYMSPEQAEMSGLDIDTRSDVYSLGVLLYELLTGTTPFDTKALLESGFDEMMRAIREDEPHTPSRRVSSLGETGTRTAEQRKVDLKKLSTLLKGDLDWIVMKCLEKDRTRRYETATGLAADIKRHLTDEPVTASPPGAGYKLRKFVRRNRGQVIAAGVVLAALVLGAIGTTMGMLRAFDQKARADLEATNVALAAEAEAKANVEAQDNERNALAAAKRAETAKEEEADARKRAEAIGEFVTAALKAGDAENKGGGQDVTILAAMDNAISDIATGRFKDDPETEADLNSTIGTILMNNGREQQAEPLFSQALELARRVHLGDHEHVAHCINDLGHVRLLLGRATDAEPLMVQALEMNRRLHPGDSLDVATSLNSLATVNQALGRAAEAERLFVEALDLYHRLLPGDHQDVAPILHNLARVREKSGHPAEAEPLLVQALEISRRLYPGDRPQVAFMLCSLAGLQSTLGRPLDAEPNLVLALDIYKRLYKGDHPSLARAMADLACVRDDLGRPADAETLYVQALEMIRRLYPGDHADVARSLSNLALMWADHGRPAAAEPLAAEALAMMQRLVSGDHPDVALFLNTVAHLRLLLGRHAEAEPLLVSALEMVRRIYSGDHPDTARCLDNLAKARDGLGRGAEAESLMLEALEMRRRLWKGDHPDVVKGLNNLAQMRSKHGRHAEAEPLYLELLQIHQRIHKGDHHDVASSLRDVALARAALGRLPEAEPLFALAVEMIQRLWKGDHPDVAKGLAILASMRLDLGRYAEAELLFVSALAMYQRLSPGGDPSLLNVRNSLAIVYWNQKKLDKSIPLFEEVLKAKEAALGRQHPSTQTVLGNLGMNYRDAGRLAEAIPLLEEVYRSSKDPESLTWATAQLIDAYAKEADQNDPASITRVVGRLKTTIEATRAMMPKDSAELAGALVTFCLTLLRLHAYDDAEPLLRECLAVREKLQPNHWSTFNTKSLLGDALLGQKKLADAEPLLLAGYRGMNERKATIPPQGKTRIPESLERLVKLHESTGNSAEVAAWRKLLDAARVGESRPASRGS